MNYQSGINGEGERDCGERWSLIEGELAPGALIDIGSAEGYFPLRAARELGMMAVSVEADAQRAAVQTAAARDLEGRVAVCRRGFGSDFAWRLADTCEFFENALLLSVLHWFQEPEEILASVCAMAGRVFVELPEPDDMRACGIGVRLKMGDDLQGWLERYSGRSVRLLGAVKAHTSGIRRVWVIEGPMERRPRRAYLGAPVYAGRFRQEWDGERLTFTINDCYSPWMPGVNVHTLGQMGVTYPGRAWWQGAVMKALKEYEALNGAHEDKRIWNVLATAEGLRWIDGRCLAPQDGIEGDLERFGE